MSRVLQVHASLLQQRTEIRNNPMTLHWMRRCWDVSRRSCPLRMTRGDYDDFYGKLLRQMTAKWDDGLAAALLSRMWERDARLFDDLDYSRFCCSIFFFVEMWVNDISIEEYSRIFAHIHDILKGEEEPNTNARSTTLEAFLDALVAQLDLEQDNASIGRSIIFDAERFNYRTGGWLPSMILNTKSAKMQLSVKSAGTRSIEYVSANRQRRRSLPSLGRVEITNQHQLRPMSSRVAIQSMGAGAMSVRLVPKRLELLPCRNQGCFRLDS